jgi:hypothetical protein
VVRVRKLETVPVNAIGGIPFPEITERPVLGLVREWIRLPVPPAV